MCTDLMTQFRLIFPELNPRQAVLATQVTSTLSTFTTCVSPTSLSRPFPAREVMAPFLESISTKKTVSRRLQADIHNLLLAFEDMTSTTSEPSIDSPSDLREELRALRRIAEIRHIVVCALETSRCTFQCKLREAVRASAVVIWCKEKRLGDGDRLYETLKEWMKCHRRDARTLREVDSALYKLHRMLEDPKYPYENLPRSSSARSSSGRVSFDDTIGTSGRRTMGTESSRSHRSQRSSRSDYDSGSEYEDQVRGYGMELGDTVSRRRERSSRSISSRRSQRSSKSSISSRSPRSSRSTRKRRSRDENRSERRRWPWQRSRSSYDH